MLITEASSTDGYEDNWTVECPCCENEISYSGFFDSGQLNECDKCKTKFKTTKLWISENEYIQ